MSKQMIINANAAEEIRVAIVENNRLIDLDVENQSRTKQKGNIYKGLVANVEDSLEAAFIEFGDDKQAFLSLSEVRPSLYPEHLKGQKRPKISDVLKRGQEIVVQVTKDEIGSKGAAVTTYLSLPGRFVVLMHSDDSGGGVSRKIADEDARRRAREMLSRLDVPDGMAVIIRTAGVNRPRVDLYRDLKALAAQWETIDRGSQLGRAPTILYKEPDLVLRTIRDYFSGDIKKVILDSDEEYDEAHSYFEARMPELDQILELYSGKRPIFEEYGIEKAIEDLFDREVKLPSGGSICIDQTEALVAVDVNSGKSTKEDGHEATVYKTNLEAARELARQLRLRDLGGIIVVDFIDMTSRRHDRDVERVLKESMKNDKAKVKIGRISENGTLELTRQRLRQAHRLVSFAQCPNCAGTGSVRDPEGLALSALRQIQTYVASKKQLARLVARMPVDVANVLNNTKRRELIELEMSEEHPVHVSIVGDERMSGNELKLEDERRGRAGLDAARAVTDPRLVGERGRRRRRPRRGEEPMQPSKTVPPPSIGPTPTFLENEDGFQALDAAHEEESREAHRERETRFDDPLTDALFGDAPALELEQAESSLEEAPEPPLARKKRRRSRRRRKKGEVGENGEELKADGEPRPEEPMAEAAASETAAGDDTPGDGDAPRKRRRRGRRGKGRRDAAAEGEVAGNGEAVVAAESEDAPAEAADAEAGGNEEAKLDADAEAPVKKKRTRRSRAKKVVAAEDAEADAPVAASDDGPSAEAAPNGELEAGEEAPAAPAKKKRATRRPRARKVEGAEPVVATEAVAAAEPTTPEA